MEFPVGTQRATVVQNGLGRSGNGTEQLAVQLQDEAGHSGTWYGFFSEKGYPVTERALKEALGWDPAEHGYDFSALAQSDLFAGREVEIVVRSETYEGKPQIKIAFLNGIGGGLQMKERMSADEVSDFSRRMRARITGGAPVKATSAPKSDGIPI